MAPVEVEVIPLTSWIMNIKVVNKAFEIPLVMSAYALIARLASPLTPLVEKPLNIITAMVEVGFSTTIAVVGKIDTIACGGIDQLINKVPALKEGTPELIAHSKETATTYATSAAVYVASFSLAHVFLKIVDLELDIVEGAIKLTGCTTTLSILEKIHTTANTIRISGKKMAGTEKAKRIEEASTFGAVLEVSGLGFLVGPVEKLVVKMQMKLLTKIE
eukprot:GFUD01116026.1.p1 GENE.GFUD01116026.1~~GFUD01116026.1.p1  ORF type:complete len:218 (+),score=47.04 GFUD01116026.1:32-685(+)